MQFRILRSASPLPVLMTVLLACSSSIVWAQDSGPAAPDSSAAQEEGKSDAEKAPPVQEDPDDDSTVIEVPLVKKIVLGGQIRVRGEYKDPVDYRIPGTAGRPAAQNVEDGDEIFLLRTRLHLDVDIIDDLQAFVELQDSRIFGPEGSVLGNVDTTDLHQGWVRFTNLLGHPLSLTAGRMEVPDLGDKRLVGSLDWHNLARAWDGLAVHWTPEDFWIYGSSAVVREDAGTGGEDQYFHALYASYRGLEAHEIDAFLFARNLRDEPVTGEDGVPGDITDYTIGMRFKGATSGLDYGAEFAFQFGDYATDDVSASAIAVTLGYTFSHEWKPRLGVEVTRASGDDDPTDGDRGTFDPLLSFGHLHHGFYDVVIWKNVRTYQVNLRAAPTDWLTVTLQGHAFQLDEETDGWYSVPVGATIRRDATGNSGDDIGSELDLHAKIKVSERVGLWLGYTRFFAGSFVEDTGPSPDGNWFFLNMTVRF